MPARLDVPSRAELIALAQQAAAAVGIDGFVTRREFLAHTGLTLAAIRRHFGCWSDLCDTAGLRLYHTALSDEQILEAMHDAYIAMGGGRRRNTFLQFFPYSSAAIDR